MLRRLSGFGYAAAAGALLIGAVEVAALGGDGGVQVNWKSRGPSSPATASRDTQAAQPAFTSRREESSSSDGLNWRSHWPKSSKPAPVVSASELRLQSASGAAAGAAQGASQVTSAFAETPVGEKNSGQVRKAAQLQPLDPLYDPFGDRVARQSEGPPPVQLDPALPMPTPGADSPDAPAPAGEPSLDPMPMRPSPMNGLDPRARPMVPEAMGRTPQLPRPFEKTYCEDPGNCYVDMKTLRQLGKGFLDITPDLEPNVADPDGVRRMDYMGGTEIRTWADRDNQAVAQGRLVDFKDGRVVIESTDGEIVRIPFENLSSNDLCYFTAWWRLPQECTLGDEMFPGRDWVAMTWTWKASGLCHKPLYFEDHRLERYGHTTGPLVQPVLSGAHFFLNIAVLPYKMGINPPNECQYALGYYRPGSCAPWLLEPIPLSLRGALYQTGAVAVGVTAIP
ncbi:MAG: SHD1 domain-containing protein [Pirellulaceae bacterium]